tara:strand:- start:445 stop:651 length:207 start_codon:yes stop_codon:yes gene_type:complete
MSFFGGGSKGGGSSETVVNTEPYAPAQPALNQIISEAGTIYNQGPTGAGYVATKHTNFTRISCTRNYG